MSSSIAIPKRKGKGPAHDHRNSSSSSSFAASTGPSTPNNYNYNFIPSPNRFSYGSGGSPRSYGSSTPSSSSSSLPSGSSPQTSASSMRRRESLMSETFSRQEHTVVNVGGDEEGEGGLRLITCVKASQGFDWNQEMFLPSYIDYHFDDLERRQDPVQDIILTDEEVRNMFPSDTRQ
ncbi:hypothetical protein IG631_10963 [Alternaria alternata]|nr:hypothetical protein IG631_10963 [Alternaria alternata]